LANCSRRIRPNLAAGLSFWRSGTSVGIFGRFFVAFGNFAVFVAFGNFAVFVAFGNFAVFVAFGNFFPDFFLAGFSASSSQWSDWASELKRRPSTFNKNFYSRIDRGIFFGTFEPGFMRYQTKIVPSANKCFSEKTRP
jgi:hypothetical protein